MEQRAKTHTLRPEGGQQVHEVALGTEGVLDAADAYQHASQRNPADAAAFAGLGASWLAAGDAERAVTAYQRAVQLKPDVSGFQAALGRAYLTKGDRARALAAYNRALELDPDNQAARSGAAALKGESK